MIYDFLRRACAQEDVSEYCTGFDFEQHSNVSEFTLEGYLLLALFNNDEKNSRKKPLNQHGTYTFPRTAIMEHLRTKFNGKPDHFLVKMLPCESGIFFKIITKKLEKNT